MATLKQRGLKAVPPSEDTAGITRIEYALTAEYKHPRKGSYWIKMGASITPLEDETAEEAKGRLVEFVVNGLNEQIEELKA